MMLIVLKHFNMSSIGRTLGYTNRTTQTAHRGEFLDGVGARGTASSAPT